MLDAFFVAYNSSQEADFLILQLIFATKYHRAIEIYCFLIVAMHLIKNCGGFDNALIIHSCSSSLLPFPDQFLH